MNKELQRLKLEEQASREDGRNMPKSRQAGYTGHPIWPEDYITVELDRAIARPENPRQYTISGQTVLLRRRHR